MIAPAPATAGVWTEAVPWLRAAAVAASIVAVMAAARWWQATRLPPAELVRKLVHVAVGAVACTLPWLFDRDGPVLGLCGAALAMMLALRIVPRLRAGVGQTLHAVPRRSTGELCFVVAIGVLWLLVADRPAFYVASLLVLALADAAAALVGRQLGARRYSTEDGLKSVEGSSAFVAVAFLVVAVAMLIDGSTPGRAFLIGLTAAVLLMLVEAIAWRGTDNLFVPVVASVLLLRWADADIETLLGRLAAAVCLVGAVLLWRRRTTLIDSAAMAGGLFLYAAWAIGGWPWLVAPGLLLAAQPAILGRQALRRVREHGIAAVLAGGGAGFAWLVVFAARGDAIAMAPYAASFGAAAIMLASVSIGYHQPRRGTAVMQVGAAAIVAAIAIAAAIVAPPNIPMAPNGMTVLAAILIVVAVISRLLPVAPGDEPAGWRWLARGAIVGAASIGAWLAFAPVGDDAALVLANSPVTPTAVRSEPIE